MATTVYDQRLIDEAVKIVEGGSCAVSKPVRAGFTSSTVLACDQQHKRLLAIAPTRKILTDTINNVSPDAVRIPGNIECLKVAEDVARTPILAELPVSLPDCSKCKKIGECHILDIITVEDPQKMDLTYAKLETIMLSRGGTAKLIVGKISRAEVVMLDEAHILSLPSAVTVKTFTQVNIPERYKILTEVRDSWLGLCLRNAGDIRELLAQGSENHTSKHLAKSVFNLAPLEWNYLRKAWGQLKKAAIEQTKMAERRELSDRDILMLRDIITILGTDAIDLRYISEDEGESGAVYISTSKSRQWLVLHEFLTKHVLNACIVFGSATLFEPYPGYFPELAGKEIRQCVFPDIRSATEKLTLIPDKWTLSHRNFTSNLPRIISTVRKIMRREQESIFLLAPNKATARIIQGLLENEGMADVVVDYFRSDGTLGVEHSERICIAIGLAQVPTNAYDALARGDSPEERWLDSQRLRNMSVDAATWQGVNRARDPEGLVESKVYFVGTRFNRVKQVATWGTERMLELVRIREFDFKEGGTYKSAMFAVSVGETIQTPRIQGEDSYARHSEDRNTIENSTVNIETFILST